MLDESLIREVLRAALASGGRFAEIFAEERRSTQIRLDDRRIEELSVGIDRGAGLRVIAGDTTAYAYSNRLDRGSLVEAAEAAAAGARDGGEDVQLVDLRRVHPDVVHPAREPAEGVPAERKVDWLREADEAARSHGPEVRQVVVGYGDTVQRMLVAGSEGSWVEEERHRVRLMTHVVAARDDVVQTGFDGPAGLGGTELLEAHPPQVVGAEAARMAVTMLDGISAPAGEMPVVLGPAGGGVLFHEACGHGLEADTVGKDASVYRGKLGERLGSSLVTGVDDSTLPGVWGSFSFDDEGTPAARTVLFEDGALVGYLYDRFWSRKGETEPTANGRRQSYAHLPIPRMTNTSIVPREGDPDDIVADTKRGVYAKVLGGGQVNPATGDFVFGISEGYLIEDGKITRPVRGANLIGNGTAILHAVDAVAGDFDARPGTCGKDGQGVPVSTGSPTLRIANMTVGGTGG
ncbi:MAG TPA: TldD/PmbA family protein [Actinomycetota bacterium]|nr:TldD/PmbA family protein [Actinomycetota bacterium]